VLFSVRGGYRGGVGKNYLVEGGGGGGGRAREVK